MTSDSEMNVQRVTRGMKRKQALADPTEDVDAVDSHKVKRSKTSPPSDEHNLDRTNKAHRRKKNPSSIAKAAKAEGASRKTNEKKATREASIPAQTSEWSLASDSQTDAAAATRAQNAVDKFGAARGQDTVGQKNTPESKILVEQQHPYEQLSVAQQHPIEQQHYVEKHHAPEHRNGVEQHHPNKQHHPIERQLPSDDQSTAATHSPLQEQSYEQERVHLQKKVTSKLEPEPPKDFSVEAIRARQAERDRVRALNPELSASKPKHGHGLTATGHAPTTGWLDPPNRQGRILRNETKLRDEDLLNAAASMSNAILDASGELHEALGVDPASPAATASNGSEGLQDLYKKVLCGDNDNWEGSAASLRAESSLSSGMFVIALLNAWVYQHVLRGPCPTELAETIKNQLGDSAETINSVMAFNFHCTLIDLLHKSAFEELRLGKCEEKLRAASQRLTTRLFLTMEAHILAMASEIKLVSSKRPRRTHRKALMGFRRNIEKFLFLALTLKAKMDTSLDDYDVSWPTPGHARRPDSMRSWSGALGHSYLLPPEPDDGTLVAFTVFPQFITLSDGDATVNRTFVKAGVVYEAEQEEEEEL